MKRTKSKSRKAIGYSCLPETHQRIEKIRRKRGLKSVGRVLDADYAPSTANMPDK